MAYNYRRRYYRPGRRYYNPAATRRRIARIKSLTRAKGFRIGATIAAVTIVAPFLVGYIQKR